ncbi:sialic acid-binding Ig-like lectin 14 isoform X2 [Macrotis lagotis]|uniref:sialic acid-binding Ig-like lectin 14 isoform X2 n=1 Tax=Macrotis lagotis TaxID=92651 RepID=UPI003D69B1B4
MARVKGLQSASEKKYWDLRSTVVPGQGPKMRSELLLFLVVFFCRRTLAQFRPNVQLPSSVTVREGLCVTVPCKVSLSSFESSLYFYASWFREGADTTRDKPVATNNGLQQVQEETQGRFSIPWISWHLSSSCSLYISDVQKSDSGRYFLEVATGKSLKHSYLDLPVYVNVTALTQKPDIYVPQVLEPGHPVTLNCTFPGACRQGTPPIFSWSGTALSFQNHKATSFPKISLTPMPRDHGSNLTCLVTFPTANVSTERTIQLNVSYTPKNLNIHVVWRNQTVIPGTGSYLLLPERETLLLVCIVDSNLSAMFTWTWEDQPMNSSPTSDSQTLSLELPSLKVRDSGEYTCQVHHPFGTQSATLNLLVKVSLFLLPYHSFSSAPVQNNSSRPLIIFLLQGVLMATGFLLTWLHFLISD